MQNHITFEVNFSKNEVSKALNFICNEYYPMSSINQSLNTYIVKEIGNSLLLPVQININLITKTDNITVITLNNMVIINNANNQYYIKLLYDKITHLITLILQNPSIITDTEYRKILLTQENQRQQKINRLISKVNDKISKSVNLSTIEQLKVYIFQSDKNKILLDDILENATLKISHDTTTSEINFLYQEVISEYFEKSNYSVKITPKLLFDYCKENIKSFY